MLEYGDGIPKIPLIWVHTLYRRLKKTEFVDAELSLRYWASHDNLFQFALVPLQSYENYQLAWVTEHELIAQWQTPLNYPRAMALIKKTALGFIISSKRRASLYGSMAPSAFGCGVNCTNGCIVATRDSLLAWGLLFKLGSRTRAAFDTSKLLRSRQTADEEVYALIKLSRNIENPHRNRVQGLLKSVVKFRTKMHWPKTSTPLGVLPLCHPHFISQCEKWLRNIILQYKYLFPSFHVPKNSLREVPHQSIKKFLHNFQSWEETMWDPAFKLDSVPCPCAKYRNKLPDRCFSSGHVAAGLEEFEAMVPGCGSITSASAASTFFPGRAHRMTKSRALFDQWLKRHRLPTTLHPMFQELCEEQWLQHVNMLEQAPRLNWAMLQKVKSTLHKDLVLYDEDHHPRSSTMRIIIPIILCASVLGFSFAHFVTHGPHGMIPQSSRAWMARQKNGGRKSALLPRGTVFLKRKKQFAKGRTIFSYAQSFVQQTVGDGIHCFDRDCPDAVLRQSRYAKHGDHRKLSTAQIAAWLSALTKAGCPHILETEKTRTK